jgi:hypothetical protein
LDAPGDLDPGAVRWGLDAVITVAAEDVCTRVHRLAAQRIGEGGLPDTGLTADQDEAAPAGPRRGQAVVQEGELMVAADQRCWCR